MRVKLLSSVPRENLNFTFLGVMSLSVAEICTTSWSVEDREDGQLWCWDGLGFSDGDFGVRPDRDCH